MNQPAPPGGGWKRAARVATVCCSVALVGVYVLYRAGGTLLPSTKSGRIAPEQMEGITGTAPTTQPEPSRRRTLLPGSKSNNHNEDGQNILFGTGTAEGPTTNPFERAFLPGSKVMAPVIRSGEGPTTAPGSNPAPRP